MLRTVSGDCEPRRMGGFEFPYNKFPGFLLGYCKIVDLGDDVDVIKRRKKRKWNGYFVVF